MAEGRDTPDLPRGLIDRRGTPISKGARLPSIRGPRDLTLGGIPKKIFTPNIPVRKPVEQKEQKEKDKPQNSQSETTPKSKLVKPKPNIPKSSDRGRGKGRGQDIIQSHSIFEQGPSDKSVPKNTNNTTESIGGKFHSHTPKSSSKVRKTDFQQETKDVLNSLLRDDFIDDKHKKDKFLEPVQLPLASFNLTLEEKPIEVKEEPGIDIEMKDVHKKLIQPSDNVLDTLTKTETGELLFFQFPDCMPGTPAKKTQTEDDDKQEETPQSQMLSDFSEGSVGKLVIRKSGRAQLVMGNVTMDVSMGTKCGFLQDVVSIRTNENSGDLSVLGHIKHRLVCTPNFDSMLNT